MNNPKTMQALQFVGYQKPCKFREQLREGLGAEP